MLTPTQLKNYDFQSVGRNAYKATDVDTYMSEICESYEQMFRENGELVKKLSLLADKLAEYKSDSDNIRNALLTAERMKEKIVQEAEEQAKSMLAEAEDKVKTAIETINEKSTEIIEKANDGAEQIVYDAQTKADDIMRVAQENSTKLLSKAQAIYDEQMGTLRVDAERESIALAQLKESATQLRATLTSLYSKHLALIEEIPTFDDEVEPEESEEQFDIEFAPDDEVEKTLADFFDNDDTSDDFEDIDSKSESEIDKYVLTEDEEVDTEISSAVNDDISEYAQEDDEEKEADPNLEYVPLDYINESEKEDDFDDQSDKGEYQGGFEEEYQEEEEKKYDENGQSYFDEDIKNFSVDVENLYSEDDDDDVMTLKNFFKEKQEN